LPEFIVISSHVIIGERLADQEYQLNLF